MLDTRSTLIDAAERVFARDGFEGASMREVMREAGANPAAVHYHFGGKDGLLEAVLDRVIAPMSERRIALLSDLRATQPRGPLNLAALVEAFLRPDFEAIASLQARGPGRAALFGQVYGAPTESVRRLVAQQFDPVGEVFMPEFAMALPDLDPDTLGWRVRWCVVGVIVALFSNADLADGPLGADPHAALGRAVDFVTAGLHGADSTDT